MKKPTLNARESDNNGSVENQSRRADRSAPVRGDFEEMRKRGGGAERASRATNGQLRRRSAERMADELWRRMMKERERERERACTVEV